MRYLKEASAGPWATSGGPAAGSTSGSKADAGPDAAGSDRCATVNTSHLPSGDHESGECKHDARIGAVRRWKRPRRAGCMRLASSRSSGQAGDAGRLSRNPSQPTVMRRSRVMMASVGRRTGFVSGQNNSIAPHHRLYYIVANEKWLVESVVPEIHKPDASPAMPRGPTMRGSGRLGAMIPAGTG